MKKYLFLIIGLILLSCSTSKSTVEKDIVFSGQEFDMELFKGKWLTNGRRNKKQFSIYRENYTVEYADRRVLPFEIKKDSIFILSNDKTFSGRLIHLDSITVSILWGNRESITYYRP